TLEPLQDLGDFVAPIWRGEHLDQATDRLLGAVAVDLFGGRVPADDRAFQCLADDRVVGGLDDRGQPRLVCLDPPARAEIADDADQYTPTIDQRADRADFNWEERPVGTAMDSFEQNTAAVGLLHLC